jgi:hypothetical protein
MKYEVRWYATTKEVSRLPDGGYTQEKIDRSGEATVLTHTDAVKYAAELFETFEDFALTEVKILRLGDDA